MRSTLLPAVAVLAVAGCSAPSPDPGAATTRSPQASATVPATGDPALTATRISFTASDAYVVVHLEDNPTSRDLLTRLPLTLEFEEFSGREKISYLTELLTTDGSPGSAPRDGTLVYYKPWGNLGFYYNATGGHDDNLITLGTVESGMDRLDRLEQGPVTVIPQP
ncbi:cyclophilin-like fold protein [Lentzea sp. NPDC102401]|uniref:cyclophilin-like fold protein n=1 Tax=Lentzea sp. NPDC102401 TaxID=3364128 RepID=UPI0038067074